MLRIINLVLTMCATLYYGYLIYAIKHLDSGYRPMPYSLIVFISILSLFFGYIAYNHLWFGPTIIFGSPILAPFALLALFKLA